VLEVRALARHFGGRRLFGPDEPVKALDGVNLTVEEGEVVGLVGESGSGKTTLSRCVLGLDRPTSGSVLIEGVDLASHSRRERTAMRRVIQPVFQDPYSSLDPRWSVERSIREGLDVHAIGSAVERAERVVELLEQVGLPRRFGERRPAELSGGQRQRVCIAAALAAKPKLLIADEAVTALDVSVQAQVLNLLADIKADLGLAMLFVAHDLAVIEHVSDRVVVLRHGQVVETGTARQVFEAPSAEYTRELLAATPVPDPSKRQASDRRNAGTGPRLQA
jgi:ABC-type oligopeptide transport system ATPase subunit